MLELFTPEENTTTEATCDEAGDEADKTENPPPSVPPHPWRSLHLSRAMKKRGRPKGDKSAFSSFHKRKSGKSGGPAKRAGKSGPAKRRWLDDVRIIS